MGINITIKKIKKKKKNSFLVVESRPHPTKPHLHSKTTSAMMDESGQRQGKWSEEDECTRYCSRSWGIMVKKEKNSLFMKFAF